VGLMYIPTKFICSSVLWLVVLVITSHFIASTAVLLWVMNLKQC